MTPRGEDQKPGFAATAEEVFEARRREARERAAAEEEATARTVEADLALVAGDWTHVRASTDSERWGALERLARLGDPRAAEPLVAALVAIASEDLHIRGWIQDALLRIGTPAVTPLISALDGLRGGGVQAAELLGKIGDARAVPSLIASMSRPDVAEAGISALEAVLSRSRSEVATEDLQAIAELKRVVALVYRRGEEADRFATPVWYPAEEPVDCSRVKELALKELSRRQELRHP